MKNPSDYGVKKTNEINEMAKIAELQLLPISEVEEPLESALKSSNSGADTGGALSHRLMLKFQKLTNIIRKMANSDSEPLVRTRATEYLGIAQKEDPLPF